MNKNCRKCTKKDRDHISVLFPYICMVEDECDESNGALYDPISLSETEHRNPTEKIGELNNIIEVGNNNKPLLSMKDLVIDKMNEEKEKCNSCGWYYLICHNSDETICKEENLYQWSPINQVSIYEKEKIDNDYIYKEAILSFSNDPATRFHYSDKNIHIESFELGVKSKSAEKYVINKYSDIINDIMDIYYENARKYYMITNDPQWSSEMGLEDWIKDMEAKQQTDHIFYKLCKLKMLL